jgi:hypothetical protein
LPKAHQTNSKIESDKESSINKEEVENETVKLLPTAESTDSFIFYNDINDLGVKEFKKGIYYIWMKIWLFKKSYLK